VKAREFLGRNKWVVIAVILVAANLVCRWPRPGGGRAGERPPPPPGFGSPPSAEEIQRLEANMTDAQRAEFRARREADEAFLASLKGLSETERQKKVEEHLAANPPPFPPGPAPAGGSTNSLASEEIGRAGAPSRGGPGDGGPGHNHLPEPDLRRKLDKKIADERKFS